MFTEGPAQAQRVQFATPLNSPAAATPPAASYAQAPAVLPYPGPAANAPALSPLAAPGATLGAPTPYPSSTYTPPPSSTVPPAIAPGAAVQAPPANWDPYATPGAAPGALLPQDPYLQPVCPPVTMTTMQKFVQHIDLDYHWFAGNNGLNRHEELGINDIDLSVTFAFPLFFNSATPLLVTPGFGVQYWNGPISLTPPTPPPDLPPRTYDGYLDFAWNPQVTTWLGGELDARIGVYSDFNNVTTEAIRFTGSGMAVLTFSPSVKVKAGVWYLNRNVVKLLPAGGICWTPNPDIYFNILFPNPKIGKRLTTWGNTDWWVYFSGDYGGGKWQITRNNGLSPNPFVPDTNGMLDTFDYNDIRCALGLEFKTPRQFHGMFEVGGAFDRGVIYQSGLPHAYYPNNTVFVRAGLSY